MWSLTAIKHLSEISTLIQSAFPSFLLWTVAVSFVRRNSCGDALADQKRLPETFCLSSFYHDRLEPLEAL
jgi:hypothetical protein